MSRNKNKKADRKRERTRSVAATLKTTADNKRMYKEVHGFQIEFDKNED